MIKHTVKVTYELEKYPDFCRECPAFSEHEYQCHNESGYEASCALGYMKGHDMRDFRGKSKFRLCLMKNDNRVQIIGGDES